MELSVVICTYNRASILEEAIKSLGNQTVSKNKYEVIVVDNCSRDNTKAVVSKYLDFLNVIYTFEARLGLSNARNRPLEFAKADYLAYIDCDIKVRPEWLEKILLVINKIAPDIFGGPILPVYESAKPRWFLDRYETVTYTDKPGYLQQGEYLSGGNLILRKDLLKQLGGFNPGLGMQGYQLGYHEETDLIKRARETIAGIKIYYDPEIIVEHLIQRRKMSLFWPVKRSFYFARSNRVLFKEQVFKNKKSLFIYLVTIVQQIIVILLKVTLGGLFRKRSKYRYFQNYFIERTIYNFDKLFYCLGNIFRK